MMENNIFSECSNCCNSCLNKLFEVEQINEFSHSIRQIQYKKGETILKQSAFANDMLFLRKGIVKLIIESVTQKETILQLVLSDSFVNLSMLFASDIIPFTAVALKDCSVCLLKREIFDKYVTDSKKTKEFLFGLYKNESKYLINRISVLSTRNNHGKLAEALLYTSKPDMKLENVTKYMTRNDWADLAAISLESVNKILNELKNDLIIKISNEGIEIQNIELLRRLGRIG